MTIYIVNALRNKLLYGFFYNKEASVWYTDQGKIDLINLTCVLLMAIAKFIGFLFVIFTFDYSMQAGMNLGVVTVIFNFTCIIDSILFYFIFKEKLTKF